MDDKPGVPQSLGPQRAGHDLGTKQQQWVLPLPESGLHCSPCHSSWVRAFAISPLGPEVRQGVGRKEAWTPSRLVEWPADGDPGGSL